MKKFLPLFPLSLVVYPNEKLNLHIFEPRYKQLINECYAENKTFGIPSFISNKVEGYGTEMRLLALTKIYDDGRMDIQTEGVNIFKLLSFQNPAKNKLYAGGDVEQIELIDDLMDETTVELISLLKKLYKLLQFNLEVDYTQYQYLSFEIAHKVGLSIEQEYLLLTMISENERQVYLVEHLKRAIPMIADMERTKERIRLNGHFKHFDPLDF
jgi:hypothetical protein